MQLDENVFSAENIRNGVDRPTTTPNAWVADWNDPDPALTIEWNEIVSINKIEICFDNDFDHPMESVLMGHPENIMPFCVPHFKVFDEEEKLVWEEKDNHQTIRRITLPDLLQTKKLRFRFTHPSATVPAAIFAIRCYNKK